MQKEIEIKIKISDQQLKNLKEWLEQNAQTLGQIEISDYYLDNPEKTFCFDSGKGYKDCLEFLRVRITSTESFFCRKKRNVDSQGKTLSVEEEETKIDDALQALEQFKKDGFTDQFLIKKKRDVYLLENKLEVVIDEVEEMGTFVEIELKDQTDDVEIGLNKIYDLLKKIGIKEFVQFERGYFCMFLNPNYDFGEKINLVD